MGRKAGRVSGGREALVREEISRADLTLATVLAGVIWHMGQDPALRAMAEANTLERFVEGCRSDVTFPHKLVHALMAVREAATCQTSI